jgi:glyoxylase I family protein
MGAYPLRSETPTFIGAASRDNAGMTDSGSTAPDLAALADRRETLRRQYVLPEPKRPPTTGAGVHHLALICADPERTILFYQDLVGFPLVELFENRDYPGSSHFFFDIGNRNMLAFFDFPGLGLEPVPEGLGGIQHVAISVTPEAFEAAKARLTDAGVEYLGPDMGVEESIYFKDPDNIQVELIRQPLFEMPESAPQDS